MTRRLGRAPVGSTSRAAVVLTTGRTVGFAIAFAIPIVLARALSQEAFGLYKYIFLLYSTLGFMQLGMAESLYFFVPKSKREAGPAVANAVVTLMGAGAASVAVLVLCASRIARWSGDAAVAPYLPLLGIFLALMLVATPLEIVMVSRKQYMGGAITYAASDALRAAFLIAPGAFSHDLGLVLAGVTAFAAIRCVALGWYLVREFGASLHLDSLIWRAQFAYALPFAVAVVIEILQVNLHQYVVWARFDAATFAIYSVGCLQIPLVDLLATSTANVMMVRMCEEETARAERARMWRDAVERLAFVFVPLVAALLLTGRDLVIALFTARYAASTPVFLVSVSMIALASFPVDAVLRVYAETRFLVAMNLVRLGVIAVGIIFCIRTFGLPGAMLITVAGTCVSKTFAIWRIRRLVGVSWTAVLPWRALAVIVAVAAVSACPALWLHARLSMLSSLLRGAATASAYALVYLGVTAGHRWLTHGQVAGVVAAELEDSNPIV